MEETYLINFSSYQKNTYFSNLTATSDRVTFYTTNTLNLNKGL